MHPFLELSKPEPESQPRLAGGKQDYIENVAARTPYIPRLASTGSGQEILTGLELTYLDMAD
jgi:hypothetical protein